MRTNPVGGALAATTMNLPASRPRPLLQKSGDAQRQPPQAPRSPSPRQEAEWRCCAGGREAGRRARSDGTGRPIVTAPGAAPEGGNPAAGGAGCRGGLLFGYFLLARQEKVTRRARRNRQSVPRNVLRSGSGVWAGSLGIGAREAGVCSRRGLMGAANCPDPLAQRLNCAIPELSVALPKAPENRGVPL